MAFDFARARTNMVENQVRTNDVTDQAVQDAMASVARESLCPPDKAALAYAEASVPYAPGRRLMEPRDVAKLLQALAPKPGERALAVAAPYAALVLAAIGCRVTALDEAEPLAAVRGALEAAGVEAQAADPARPGDLGPFDVIVCEGAVAHIPQAWLDALAAGGRLGAVERSGPGGKARLVLRGADGLLARRELFDSTPHVLPGFAPVPVFSL
jgi:protein-L-isoaspartate(D-aspartate) O-methyltransferase